MINKVLLYSSIAVVYLRLFLPSILKQHYPQIAEELTGLIIVSLIYVMGIVMAIKLYMNRQSIGRHGFEWPLGLLVLASAASLSYSCYQAGSIVDGMQTVAYIVYFLILFVLFQTAQARKNFLYAFVAALALIGVTALIEWFQPSSSYLHGTDRPVDVQLAYHRVGSVFNAPNVFAGFLMLVLPLMAALFLSVQVQWQRMLIACLILVLLTAWVMTLSLLCTLSVGLVTLVFAPWLMKSWFNRHLNPRIYVGMLLSALALIAVILFVRSDFSVEARLSYLSAAVESLKLYWLQGSGADTFKFLSTAYTENNSYSGYVHNSYLQIWLETGLLGLIAIILFLAAWGRKLIQVLSIKSTEASAKILLGLGLGLTAFYVDNLTNFTLLSKDVSLFAWIALSAVCALMLKPEAVRTDAKGIAGRFMIGMMAAVLLGALLFQSVFLIGATLRYQQAMRWLEKKDFIKADQLLQEARDLDGHNQFYPAAQGMAYAARYRQSKDRRLLAKAEARFLEAAVECPFYYMNYVMLAYLAKEEQDLVKQKIYLSRVAQLCPVRYDSLRVELGL